VFRVLLLVPFGWAATVVLLVALYASNLRLGLCVTFLLLTYVGYVSLILLPRHYFHMLVVPLWIGGFVVHHGAVAAGRWLRTSSHGGFGAGAVPPAPVHWRSALRGVAILAALCLTAWVVLAVSRSYQQSRLRTAIEAYDVEENFVALKLVETSRAGGRNGLEIADGLTHGSLSSPSEGVYAANYLVVDVECSAPVDSIITTSYERPAYWQQATRVRCSTGARQWRLFLPTYDIDPQIHLRGLEWNGADPIRVRSVRRIRDLAATPLLLKLTLPEDWRSQPLYHVLSLAALERPQPF
jgi:hypothetical protein